MNEYGIRRHPDYRVRASSELAAGDVARLSRERFVLPNGVEAEQDIISLPDAVAIAPLDTEGRLVLIEQFRPAVGGFIHEIPSGRPEADESLEVAAKRELEEETGLIANRWTRLASLLMIPGTSAHRLHFFLAEDLGAGSFSPEAAECIRVRRVPFASLVERLVRDAPGSTPIVDTKTHLALLHVARLIESRTGGSA